MSTTPNYGFNLPKDGDFNWGSELNANWERLDKILAAGVKKTLTFNYFLDQAPSTAPHDIWVLGLNTPIDTSALSSGSSPVDLIPTSGSGGIGRLLLDVTGGADTTGDIGLSGTSRPLGSGTSIPAATETLAISGTGEYISGKTWLLPDGSPGFPITLTTTDVDIDFDWSLVSVFNNNFRRFILQKVTILSEPIAGSSAGTITMDKVVVSGQSYSSTELLTGRLDFGTNYSSFYEPGLYQDSLVLDETIESCSGEGLLCKINLDSQSGWRQIRVEIDIEELPVSLS